ncbi:MAG: bifunctional 4-hydroxy-2-oxoglutarate aldolase/2-dehydro-3-deoxy-phosphogluconate aldolase [Ruminococcaceae bacterium]|nr:bifunctional 4-hydroxy-2-oxoglutarate aldolase/2-dehydro-3-deoxy-phosphogluconate aldolase [Oscillospiraceae bacterium]
MMKNTIEQIEKNKVIVIVRGVEKEKLIPMCQAIYDGGLRLIECTYDASGKISDEEIAGNIKMLAEHFEGKMIVGAGTVLTEKQVELTKKAGGKFIISPDTNPDIIKKTKEEELVSIPGALTPSEITQANRSGADFVKIFPMDMMGVKYIKDLKAPLSHVKLLAVGGVTADNMKDYLDAGASGIGIGSGVVNKKLISENNFEEITKLARNYSKNI